MITSLQPFLQTSLKKEKQQNKKRRKKEEIILRKKGSDLELSLLLVLIISIDSFIHSF